jgi:glycogen debranching enzyme
MPTTWLNYTQQEQSVMELPKLEKGTARYAIVIAASTKSADDARATYESLSENFERMEQESAKYYTDYLARTVALDLPDDELEQAYDWARVSTIQGLVSSPLLGSGLVAGYKLSGGTQRPGFAWFFGRDSLWTDLALNSISDFATTRTALEFISKFQSKEGKLPHEISQSASLVEWDKLPYLYASADATPLYIIAFHDYVTASGDIAFAKEKWESIQRAYDFLRSTWDERGFPKNEGVGHGWVEGGPLLPVKTELYQSGLGLAAVRDFAELAKLTGNAADVPADLEQRRKQLNETFWIADKNYYAFALRSDNSLVQIPSVEATVPMWFDVLDPAKSEQMVGLLAREDHMADWGMRINSSRETFYDPQGYHFGAVWPLFTGWASVGEYKVHRADAGYANLRANALLFDSPLGHFTEVLSGDYYTTISYASPHQIWSAAMVISPMLRGLFGLNVNALTHTVTLTPHLPYSWDSATISNVKVGEANLSFTIRRSDSSIQLETKNSGKHAVDVEFSPAVSMRAQVSGVEVGGHSIKSLVKQSTTDQHATISISAAPGTTSVLLTVRNDFGIDYAPALPPYGAKSRNLKIISQRWSADRNTLTLQVSGRAGRHYSLRFFGDAKPSGIEGAKTVDNTLLISFPESASEEYVEQTVTIRFATSRAKGASSR